MTIIQTTLLQRMHRCGKMTLEWKHAAVNPTRTDAVRRDQEGQEAFGGLPDQLPRQYMHNKENAVTMRLSAH